MIAPIPTTGPGTAAELARRAVESGADLILAAGGDGTINEVVNGMVHSHVPLGIVPGGTANVLASELGLAKKIPGLDGLLEKCEPHRVSLGLLSKPDGSPPRYFLSMAGVGLDAHIVYNINLNLKAAAGKLAYYIAGFSQLRGRLPEFSVRADGKSFACTFALVSRVRNYGGDLQIARSASLFHNHFELVLFQGRNPFRYLKYMLGVITGRLHGMQGISVLKAHRVDFTDPTDPRVYIQIDGEHAGRLPVSVESVPDALTLLIPRSYPRPVLDD